MALRTPRTLDRRHFLRSVSGLVTAAFGAGLTRADDLPRNINPRAISGDSAEPDWKERVTITVGPTKSVSPNCYLAAFNLRSMM
jgi:hypothetical protein